MIICHLDQTNQMVHKSRVQVDIIIQVLDLATHNEHYSLCACITLAMHYHVIFSCIQLQVANMSVMCAVHLNEMYINIL